MHVFLEDEFVHRFIEAGIEDRELLQRICNCLQCEASQREARAFLLVSIGVFLTNLSQRSDIRFVELSDVRNGNGVLHHAPADGLADWRKWLLSNRTPLREVNALGWGRGAMKAVVKDKKIEPRLMMPIALSYDHRVIDGGEAARFTVELVQAFENFKEENIKI